MFQANRQTRLRSTGCGKAYPHHDCVREVQLRKGVAMSMSITREVLEGYLECNYKGRLRLVCERGEESDYQKLISEEEVQARSLAFPHLLACHPEGESCRGARLTAADLGRG